MVNEKKFFVRINVSINDSVDIDYISILTEKEIKKYEKLINEKINEEYIEILIGHDVSIVYKEDLLNALKYAKEINKDQEDFFYFLELSYGDFEGFLEDYFDSLEQ